MSENVERKRFPCIEKKFIVGTYEKHYSQVLIKILLHVCVSDSCEKGGGGSRSLSSLKQKESKWISLRKKLKINSGGSISKKSEGQKEEETSTETVDSTAPLKSLNSKRSLFQRAKTLALIPVGRGRDSSEEPKPERNRQNRKQQVIQEPKELFNVGGEMNLIPLELLIDINDLQLEPK